MIQSFDTQLQAVLRALSEVVAPTLSEAEKHVVEQLHMSLATLKFIKARVPEARRFFRMELKSYMALAGEAAAIADVDLAEQCSAIEDAIATGQAELERPESDVDDYQAITRRLREQLADLSNSADGKPCKQRLDAMILDRSEFLILQNRLWVSPFGLEPNLEALPKTAW